MLLDAEKKDVEWALKALAAKAVLPNRYRAYYKGDQAQMIDPQRLRNIFGGLFEDFHLNLCSTVVDALVDRLEVSGFSGDSALDLWKRNGMRRLQGEVHQEAVAAGDAYVIVWPNEGQEAVWYPQDAHEVAVEYDKEQRGRITKAAKAWTDGDRLRLNLYYPDRLEKYQAKKPKAGEQVKAGSVEYFVAEGRPDHKEANEWDEVPVFHFANNARIGRPGVSELKDAVPVQDFLNYVAFSLLVGVEFQAVRQRWATGLEVDVDPVTGEPKSNPFRAGAERLWILPGDVKLGELQAADLDQLARVKQEADRTMAQVTRTPAHYFSPTTNLVSGESQKTAEQQLDSKVADRQAAFGDSWAAAMRFALKVEGKAVPEALDCNWANLKPRDQKAEWEIAGLKKDLGVSKQQILREQGYSEEQIEQFARDSEAPGFRDSPSPLASLGLG